jgi:hypothetical protein
MSEQYDEIVFVDPAEAFYKRVANTPLKQGATQSPIHYLFSPYDPAADLQRFNDVRRKVSRATANLPRPQAEQYM